jgi:dTDP-4-dehydrorhamnose reductase
MVEGKPIRVVDDQVLAPTYAKDLAEKMARLLETREYGLYHITSRGECSWFEFAAEIFKLLGVEPNLPPIPSEAYASRARRPSYSVLGQGRLLGVKIGEPVDWPEALRLYLHDAGHT